MTLKERLDDLQVGGFESVTRLYTGGDLQEEKVKFRNDYYYVMRNFRDKQFTCNTGITEAGGRIHFVMIFGRTA